MAVVEGQKVRGIVRGVSRGLSVGIIFSSLAAFGWVAAGAVKAADTLTEVRWAPFVGAVILQFIMMLFLMLLWERLLTILWGSQRRIDVKPIRPGIYTAYSRSWLARYIPGRVWALGGRVLLASKVGVPAEAVARSMALLLVARAHSLAGLAAFILGLLAFTISVPAAQRLLASDRKASSQKSLWSKARQRAQRFLIGPTPFSLKNSLWAVSIYGIYSSLQLVFIALIAESFVDLTLTQTFIIAGAWGLSVTLGWLSFLPVGLGVRDVLASVLSAQVLDAPTASLIVAASRIVMIAIDLAFVGAVELLALGLTSRQTQPQTSA